jgi:hypothetical protein
VDKKQLADELSRLSEQDAADVMAGLAEHQRQAKMQAGADAMREWLRPTPPEPPDDQSSRSAPINPRAPLARIINDETE